MPTPPPVRHASVDALLQAHPRSHDPKSLIRTLAREKIAIALGRGWEGPPFCPKVLASSFGIRCREVAHDIGGDGRILRQRDGRPRIEYRGDRLPVRIRFTLFHEFAHTLFPDYCDYIHHQAPALELTPAEKEFENLCDLAAVEMLFPEDHFRRDLAAHAPAEMKSAYALSELYEASLDATLLRLVEHEDRHPCAVVFLTDIKGKHPGEGPLWVKYSQKHRTFEPFIWPGTCPPPGSVALTCFVENLSITTPAQEAWLIKGVEARWLAQATRLPDIPSVPTYAKAAVLLKKLQ